MKNPYKISVVKITAVTKDAPDTRAFCLIFKDEKKQKQFSFVPGQFAMVGILGVGEVPVGIDSPPHEKRYFTITVRAVGRVTEEINKLEKGDFLTFRGPFGNGWPLNKIAKKNLLMVAGGLGIVPLKPLVDWALKKNIKGQEIQLFYGCRDFKNLLFEKHYKKWRQSLDTRIILDQACKIWNGRVGKVTELFDRRVVTNAVACVCGPPVMYCFVVPKLLQTGFAAEDIYLSLERRMHCGLGQCEHCAIGEKYVCKDGPIFSYAELKNYPQVIEAKCAESEQAFVRPPGKKKICV